METIKNAVIGYFLLLEARGGMWDDAWSREARSWFIEENSNSMEAIKEILKEYNFDDYQFNELIEYTNRDCPISSDSFGYTSEFNGYDEYPSEVCLYLYTAVKVGDDVFKKVSIFRLRDNELEEPPE